MNEDELYLRNREQVETAWRAVSITGGAPTAEPLLGAMIELFPPKSAPSDLQSARLYLQGGNTRIMKQEIIASLQVVADNLGEESETSKAAKGLLAILLEE